MDKKLQYYDMTRLLFVLLLVTHTSFGQTIKRGVTTISADSIHGDSVYNYVNQVFNERIKLTNIDKSLATIDIRLYRIQSLSNTMIVRRLYLVDTRWNSVEYYEMNEPVKITKYKLKAKYNFDNLFSQLLAYNILTLPNQSDLKNKMRKEVEVTDDGETGERKIYVTDGESYTVEIKIGNKFRVYRFDNPDVYSKFYNKVSELKDYLNIVQTFETHLYRK